MSRRMKKVFTIVGARPQFVKASVVSRSLRESAALTEVMLHTGQHFDKKMSDIFFDELGIPKPAYNLGIDSLSHGAMTGRMLEEIEKIVIAEKPDVVLVYGDTNSTLAGALAAKKLFVPVAHVEAGLRSFDLRMPEEINRILTDRISDTLYCPTDRAVKNLKVEGFETFSSRIQQPGDVMYDALLYSRNRLEPKMLKEFSLSERFVLCTIHRAENTDDPYRLRSIFAALDEIRDEIEIVLPIHPRTMLMLDKFGIETRVRLISPVGYFDMLNLIERSSIVLTDSGGLQKEAYFLGKYCITLRETTEWTELVQNGFNTLAGADAQRIVEAFHNGMVSSPNFSLQLYGKGNAGELIASDLEATLC